MIAHWMLYCAAVGLILALGAAATERALAVSGRPVRGAWAAALLLTLAFPIGVRLLPRPAPEPAAPMRVMALEDGAAAPAPAAAPERKRMDLRALDRPLLVGWGASSALALAVLAGLAMVLERRRRRWRPATVDGVPVLVSPDTGPAVVGVIRSRIVIPEWACAAEEEVRALMLEHESEHLRAGDTRLLAGALLVVALMPWNPAVWWQLRRLRLAVEVDCDSRVLRRRGDVRAYGALLLEMGRRAGGSRLAVAAFSEPTSFLERRIRSMTAPKLRHPGLRAAGFGVLAAALVAAACETPGPMQVAPASAERVYTAPDAADHGPSRVNPRELIARYYPDVLTKGAGGGATITFIVSPDGEVASHTLEPREEVQELTATDGTVRGSVRVPFRVRPMTAGANLDPDDIASVEVFRFAAGQMGPDPVGVVWVRMGEPGSRAGRGTEIRISGPAAGTAEASVPARGRRDDQQTITLTRGEGEQATPQLQRLMEKHRPRGLPAGTSQLVRVNFTLDPAGKPREIEIQGQPHPAVAEAARRVLAEIVFEPAEGHVMRLGLDFERIGRRTRSNVDVDATLRTREALTAALLQRHPEAATGGTGEYWMVADASGRVLQSGASMEDDALEAISSDRIEQMQVETLEIGGRTRKVIWIQLKG
jgi:hypothetical protein